MLCLFAAVLTFVSPAAKVFPDAPPPASAARTWTASMARGERESLQLLITAGTKSLRSLTVENALPGLTAKLSLVGFVRTAPGDPRPWAKQEPPARIGWWPDPLLPLRAFDVAAGETQPIWIRVESPRDAQPGNYRGRIIVRDAARAIATAEYTVRVFAVTMPRRQHFRNAAFMPAGNLYAHYKTPGGMESEAFFNLYRRWAREAFEQHLGPTFDMMMGWNQGQARTPSTAGPLTPTADMLSPRDHIVWPVLWRNGAFDFRRTAQLAELGREYGMSQFSIGIFDRERTWQQQPESDKQGLAEFIRAYAAYLKPRGLWDDAYIYNVDEPPAGQWDTVRNNHALVKSIAPDLKTWLCLNEPPAVRELQSSADILDVYIRQYERSGVEEFRRRGKQVIWAVCVWPHEHPNLFIEYPAVDARLIGWLTYRYGISGFEYWGLNQWGDNTGTADWFDDHSTRTRWRRTKWPWGDGWLFYPGKNGEPLSSIRFENLRDGFEDAELLHLAGPAASDLAASIANHVTSYATDPAAVEAAHIRLLHLLQ